MQLSDFEYWIDANIPHTLVSHLQSEFNVFAYSFYFLNLLNSDDYSIFLKAKEAKNVVILTKDEDFINWVILKKSPPKILWITIGNVKNQELFEKVLASFPTAVAELSNPNTDFIQLN